MKKLKLSLSTLILISFTCAAQEMDHAISMKFKDFSYLLSTPSTYAVGEKAPTIIFLHGADRSNTKHHPSKYAKRAGIEFPFIVIAPSCTSGCTWSRVDLEGVLSQAAEKVAIDPNRVYLVGYSMGGAGTWTNLKKIHHLLAAAAPLAPAGGNTSGLCEARKLPIRVYHGTNDYGYKNSLNMVDYLKTCGAQSAELISLEGQGHGIWPGIFSDSNFYDWLLSQSLPTGR